MVAAAATTAMVANFGRVYNDCEGWLRSGKNDGDGDGDGKCGGGSGGMW